MPGYQGELEISTDTGWKPSATLITGASSDVGKTSSRMIHGTTRDTRRQNVAQVRLESWGSILQPF